uniref:Uncharacterized protein n=1 Tax=Arion vulgaris TaxID=1028688 RepID=A0A0B7ARS7_9EUPU
MQQLQLLLLLVLLLGYSHAIQETGKCMQEAMSRSQATCVNFTLNTGSIVPPQGKEISHIVTNVICKNPEQSKRAIECIAINIQQCVPTDFKDYMPQPEKLSQIVDTLCDDNNKVDFDCVTKQASNMPNCLSEKAQKEGLKLDIKTFTKADVCKAYGILIECSNIELRPCGCSTVRTNEIFLLDDFFPSSCPKLTGPRVECDQKNQDFFKGTGRQSSGSTVVFFVSVVAFIYFQFCLT